MGEISDMMLDGVLCAGCGVHLSGEAGGFPRYCSKECKPENIVKGKKEKVKCPQCKKWVKDPVSESSRWSPPPWVATHNIPCRSSQSSTT